MNLRRILYDTGAPGESGGGEGNGDGGGEKSLQEQIAEAVQKETAGLLKSRDDALADKTKARKEAEELRKSFVALGGEEGIKGLVEMRKRLENDEVGKLLAEGKHEEWHERRTANMRASFEKTLEEKQREVEAANEKVVKTFKSLEKTRVETEVFAAAAKAGAEPDAVEDILLKAATLFSFDPEHGVVMRDPNDSSGKSFILGQDGKTPIRLLEWLESQKEKKRTWFPRSQGAGATGSVGSGHDQVDLTNVKSVADWKEKRKKLGLGQHDTGFHNF